MAVKSSFKKRFKEFRKKFLIKYLGTVTNFEVNSKIACLTFDDGPHPVYTPLLLDLLGNYDVKATFFMVGENASKLPEIVKRVRAEGHIIGNHTWNHLVFSDLSRMQRLSQIKKSADHINPLKNKFFRPPWGKQNFWSRLDTLILGYDVIGWNLEVNDWVEDEPKKMVKLLKTAIKPGCIILLHDNIYHSRNKEEDNYIIDDRDAMLKALEIFLKKNRNEYQFDTIEKLFEIGVPVRNYWIH